MLDGSGSMDRKGDNPIPLRPMPTRIDIELTSVGADGSWTWRAAGAREPKGILDGGILPDGASVGDQLKAESEHDVDGIRILSIVMAKQRTERAGLLELLPTGDFEPVTQQRARRERSDGGRARPRRDRGDRDRGDRPERGERRDRDDRDRGPRRERDGRAPREGGDRERRNRPHFTPPPELPQRPKPKRLRPGKLRRSEVLESIPEEQRPVAELTLQGLAAVRQRVREDNARLVAEGKPPMPEATVLKMAEELLPRLRVADWLDRAEAAKRQIEHLDLRDLRSVVAAADDPVVTRDESTRALAAELKAALATKQEEELNLWLADVEANVDIGRVVRALRLSAMPPKAGVPFPAALGAKLGEATGAALGADDPAERWVAVLEAAAFSPVRSLVTPAAPAATVTDELRTTVTRLGPLLPQIAALYGIEVAANAPAPKPLRPSPRRDQPASKRPARGPRPADRPERAESTSSGAESPEPVTDTPPAAEPAVEATLEAAAPAEATPEAAEPPAPADPSATEAAPDAPVPAEPDAPTTADTAPAEPAPDAE